MKQKIKSMPFLGWFAMWINNLLKLNNIKQKVLDQDRKIFSLQEQNKQLLQNSKILLETIKHHVREETIKQTILLEQKIDQTPAPSQTKQNLNSHLWDEYYLSFENKFRGDREHIKQRYNSYQKYIPKDTKTALDIGCGRGEWVELLQQRGIQAYGIDQNKAMTQEAKSHNIQNIITQDAFDFLQTQPDNTYDLISAFHIIEHIPFEKLIPFLLQIKRVAKPTATILLETPNPRNLYVSAYEFYIDPTHQNPLPHQTVQFLLEFLGFADVKVEFLHPFDKTMHIDEDSPIAQRLNDYFYQARDYLLVVKNDD